MPFAFNLTLDPACAMHIERVYASLAALGVPDQDLVTQYGPCVTILVVDDMVHPVAVTTAVGRQLPALGSLAVAFTEPCIAMATPPVLSLRVAATPLLLALHNAVYNALPAEEVHLHYRPAHWQPHLKLASVRGGQAAEGALLARTAAQFQPITGVLDRLEVVRYPPVQSIWQAPLKAAPPG